MRYGICLLLALTIPVSLKGSPLLIVGGGYWDAGSNHSGGLAQVEWRGSGCVCGRLRPLVIGIAPEFRSLFVGAGASFDLHSSRHMRLTPSFCPGYYAKGSGKDLGCALEFRSSIELTYECWSAMRLGVQFYHISNASLGDHNPGANALTLILAIPL